MVTSDENKKADIPASLSSIREKKKRLLLGKWLARTRLSKKKNKTAG